MIKGKAVRLKKLLKKCMEDYFGTDTKRINHAKKVTAFTEEILKKEKADYDVVIASAILHDVGIKEAERKYNLSSGKLQEKEGPPIARKILTKLGFPEDFIKEVCDIIAHHHSPGKINTNNFKILYDSDRLVNLRDECDLQDKKKLSKIIERGFLTKTGKELARKTYL